MTITTNPLTLEEQTLLADVEEIIDNEKNVDEFSDADLPSYKAAGVDLHAAGALFAREYKGANTFVIEQQTRVVSGRGITPKQARACLNAWRCERLGVKPTPKNNTGKKWDCFKCGVEFGSWPDLKAHKDAGCKPVAASTTPDAQDSDQFEPGTEVVENRTSTLGIDLRLVPDGRYAVPSVSGSSTQPWIYLTIRTVRRDVKRDRRYVYGKIVTGNQRVKAGTIEVREWSSDAKRLCGDQRPDDLAYHGEFEKELNLIVTAPEPWALLFGQQLHHCCRCGKALTDEVSKEDGIGPECIKHYLDGELKARVPYEWALYMKGKGIVAAGFPTRGEAERHAQDNNLRGAQPTYRPVGS